MSIATNAAGSDIEQFLAELRQALSDGTPHLLDLFDVFSNEARTARSRIADDLSGLVPGSRILEVGAGLMILSCQLQREGFSVTSMEPLDQGFSLFEELQQRILEFARALGCLPAVLHLPVEELRTEEPFAFAFSFNVMEHVRSVESAITHVLDALEPGGVYWFTCPNYRFPYEPHFNIPTLLSKRLTWTLLRPLILSSHRVTDPVGTWNSLNWISVPVIRNAVATLPGVKAVFRRDALAREIERVAGDPIFAARRPRWVTRLTGVLRMIRADRLATLVPVGLQPTIDCRITTTQG